MKLTARAGWLVFVVLSGCLVSRPEVPKPECEVDSECTGGKICGPGGRCTVACKADLDCAPPYACDTGACVLPAGACARATDCASGDVCTHNRCARACLAAADCGADEACVAGACLALSAGACRLDSDCTAPQACLDGRCAAACAADRDCPSPSTCQQGACALPTGACVRSADCPMGEVCGVGGRCARGCTTATQCAATEACVGGACVSLASGACRFDSECPVPQACVQGRCAEACLADRDCPFGTACQQSVCTPLAPDCFVDGDCATGEACSPQGQCVAACTSASQCAATGEACSNGACVRVGVDTAALTGAVVLTGVTDASGLSVSIEGPNRDTAQTAADGGFAFFGLVPGLYRVTVTAPGTLEGSATRELPARGGATTAVPPFTLTPAGDLTGTVTLAGRTSHEGIHVVALGTGKGTVTGPDGRFTLRQLPVGTADLLVAYTGYQSAQLPGVQVRYAQATTTTAVALQPLPSGSTFAFSSVPPATATYGEPLQYQAVAGGGGVTSVTYALVDWPGGMTINPSTGQVSWTPQSTSWAWVVISATGGGATVYQLFYIEVVPGGSLVFAGTTDRLLAVDGGAWIIGGTSVRFVDDDGGLAFTAAAEASFTRPMGTLEHLNGRSVTGYAAPGGSITGVSGPLGTLKATWPGGVIASVAGGDVRTAASAALLGGTSGVASPSTGDTVTAVTWQRGDITSIDDGRSTATGFRATTGLVGTLTATGFEDPAASWVPGTFDPLCVMNAAGNVRLGITSHTATTFVLDEDPRSAFVAGQRYFVGSCTASPATTTYTLIDASRASTPAATGRSLDLYTANGTSVGFWALTATTAPPNATLSFIAPVSSYGAIEAAATSGFYAVGSSSTGHDVLITDSTAPWSTTTSAQSRFTFEDFSTPVVISASTATTLTVRHALGTLARNRPGRGWVLTDTSSNVQLTLTLGAGGLGTVTGEWTWLDALGRSFLVVSNTASSVTLDAPIANFPLAAPLVGSLVGRASGSAQLPKVRVPSPGLVAGALAGRVPVKLTNGGAPLVFDAALLVTANDAGVFELPETACTNTTTCRGALAARAAAWTNAGWAPGPPAAPARVELRLSLSGAPNFAPDSLRGRSVALESSPAAMAVIASNDASSVVVEVPEASLPLFRAVTAGDRLWLSDPPVAAVSPLRVKLTGQGAAWTADEWVGASVVVGTGTVAGLVMANTATELDLAVSATNAMALLAAGARFALARPTAQGTGCTGTSTWIRADLTLAGATLVAGAYTHVRSELSNLRHPLAANTTSGATAFICATAFGDLLTMADRAAVFDTNGRFDLVVTDAAATMTPGTYAGQYLYIPGTSGGRFRNAITSHTATAFTVNHDSAEWFASNSPWRRVVQGAAYRVTNAASQLTVVATVSGPPLVPGELAGKWVLLSDASSVTSVVSLRVLQNTATVVTLGDVDVTELPALERPGSTGRRVMTLSRGTALRLTDPTASFTPGALVGRTLNLGQSLKALITENTATSLTARSSNQELFGEATGLASYSVDASAWEDDIMARPNGTLVVARLDGRLVEVSRAGAVTTSSPLTTGRTLTVSPAPSHLQGEFIANATSGLFSVTWSDPNWSLVPGALVNEPIRVRCSSTWQRRLVRANTRTSITVWGSEPCGNTNGRAFVVESTRLTVSGVTLSPGELRGARVWINGDEYPVRDNTATEVHLALPEVFASVSVGLPFDLVERGGTAWVVRGHAPGMTLDAVSADGDQGLLLAPSLNYFARFDGTSWSRVPYASTGNRVHAGTVSALLDDDTLVDASASFVPGALVNKRLVVGGRSFLIDSNTVNGITVTGNWTLEVPVPGTAYEVFGEDDTTDVQALQPVGSTLWLGSSSGLYRFDGTTWSHVTPESTESSPGARDGLRISDVERIFVGRNGDLFVTDQATGVSRLRGGTWRHFSVFNTQSAIGLGDGLASDRVQHVDVGPDGVTWFGTSNGLSRYDGTTWSRYGLAEGVTGFVDSVWVTPQNRVYVSNGLGLRFVEP